MMLFMGNRSLRSTSLDDLIIIVEETFKLKGSRVPLVVAGVEPPTRRNRS